MAKPYVREDRFAIFQHNQLIGYVCRVKGIGQYTSWHAGEFAEELPQYLGVISACQKMFANHRENRVSLDEDITIQQEDPMYLN